MATLKWLEGNVATWQRLREKFSCGNALLRPPNGTVASTCGGSRPTEKFSWTSSCFLLSEETKVATAIGAHKEDLSFTFIFTK